MVLMLAAKELVSCFFSPDLVVNVCAIGVGKNNRVYSINLKDGGKRILKEYFKDSEDPRDRLRTEYQALSFLWAHGIKTIPEPLGIDEKSNAALYSYVEGSAFVREKISKSDIDQAIDMIDALKELSLLPEALKIPPASEACFSIKALISVLESRLQKLLDLPLSQAPSENALRAFLKENFLPVLDEMLSWVRERAPRLAVSLEQEIEIEQRILSPSDFGFHNAVLTPDGKWIFQDFEYFGWDDPSKLICDFILHPAMSLAHELQCYFLSKVLGHFSNDEQLFKRIELQYPLWGLKWCEIILNEFLAGERDRRTFSKSIAASEWEDLKLHQLTKARRLLNNVMGSYGNFRSFFQF